ncbi:hypothetical protein [Portibacter lacus]|uniref:Uncharacterized protein n=1 Tax=Portibacter lacus TaxID=1099794 RepID=A0AA37SSK0_9BACT|nr:hypothetical protein [Portibacter lacus]GLR19673.1 hypothetical protein GCM10007940_42890 [Portibacter lacus]
MGLFDKTTDKKQDSRAAANQESESASFSMQPPVFQLVDNPLFEENELAGEMPDFDGIWGDQEEEEEEVQEAEGPGFMETQKSKGIAKKVRKYEKLNEKSSKGGIKGKLAGLSLKARVGLNKTKGKLAKTFMSEDGFSARGEKMRNRLKYGQELYDNTDKGRAKKEASKAGAEERMAAKRERNINELREMYVKEAEEANEKS